jgi:hypothetical protein
MATISRQYDNQKIVAGLTKLNPGLNFGDSRGVKDVRIDPPLANGLRRVEVTVEFGLTDAELAKILDDSLSD